MKVRPASSDDIPSIFALGKSLVNKSEFSGTSVSYLMCVNRFLRAIQSPDELLLVAEHNGAIVGFLILVMIRYWWSSDDLYVLDDGIYSERAGSGSALIRYGIAWAKQHGAREIIIALNSGIETDRSVRALNRCGLHDRGINVSIKLREENVSLAA